MQMFEECRGEDSGGPDPRAGPCFLAQGQVTPLSVSMCSAFLVVRDSLATC